VTHVELCGFPAASVSAVVSLCISPSPEFSLLLRKYIIPPLSLTLADLLLNLATGIEELLCIEAIDDCFGMCC
jgi:hypothetical protein